MLRLLSRSIASVARVGRPTPAVVRRFASTAPADADHQAVEVKAFVSRIGLQLKNPQLLTEALTHPSFEQGKEANQQRLEFLGDKVLGFFVAEHIFTTHPNFPSSSLNDAVALFVNNRLLCSVGRSLGLESIIRWQPAAEADTANAGKADRGVVKVTADTVEALIGAIYADQGPKAARAFIHKHILSRYDDLTVALQFDRPKQTLAELCAQQKKGVPVYKITAETGRNTHAPIFKVGVFADDKVLAEGRGRSIKDAEKDAATQALQKHFGLVNRYPALPSDDLTVA